jgi:hypothetical protein
MVQAVSECEQLPASFRLRVLRLEVAPQAQRMVVQIHPGGTAGDGNGGSGDGSFGSGGDGGIRGADSADGTSAAATDCGGCRLELTLHGPQAWGDAAAAALIRHLPAFRRLQVLLVRGMTPRQEAALAQVRPPPPRARGLIAFQLTPACLQSALLSARPAHYIAAVATSVPGPTPC